jgi:2-haloacid dehalogenase
VSALRPKALLFDVFGTCVDWRSSIIREGEVLGRQFDLNHVDWPAFADAWRDRYQPQMESVRNGSRPWVNLDALHRESLDQLLLTLQLDELPESVRAEFNRAWHRLDPWPDSVPGLTQLKRSFIIAPNSNGHIALQVDLAKWGGLPWDVILGAEIARAYKPQPEVYLRSAEAVGLRPSEVMMVASHNNDLVAAAACGMMTAFVPRPREHGAGQTTDLEPEHSYDVIARDFIDLATQLGSDADPAPLS